MRFYIGVLLSAVVLFFWGFAYWAILAPRLGMLKAIPADHPVVKAVTEKAMPHGVYFRPGVQPGMDKLSSEELKKAEDRSNAEFREGPIVSIMFRPGGTEPLSRDMLLQGFLHYLLTAALFGTLTRSAVSWCSLACRWGFIIALGVLGAVWIDLSPAIWMHFPWDYQLFLSGYHIGGWVIAGLPLAWSTQGIPIPPPASVP